MAAPAHVFTIGRTAEILPRTSNYCGTSHSTWNRKTAASGSTKPTTNRRWRSRTAAWESLQELVSEHKRSMRPRGPEWTVTRHRWCRRPMPRLGEVVGVVEHRAPEPHALRR